MGAAKMGPASNSRKRVASTEKESTKAKVSRIAENKGGAEDKDRTENELTEETAHSMCCFGHNTQASPPVSAEKAIPKKNGAEMLFDSDNEEERRRTYRYRHVGFIDEFDPQFLVHPDTAKGPALKILMRIAAT